MENIELFTNELTEEIIHVLKGENFKDNFKLIVSKEFSYILDSEKDVFFKSQAYENLKTKMTKQILEGGHSEIFKQQLSEVINQNLQNLEKSKYTLSEILPPSFTNSIKVYIYNESPKIIATIKEFINNPKTQRKLKEEISKSINGFNPMVAKFINANSIHAKVMEGINSYFDNQSNIMNIITSINSGIDNFMKKEISEFFIYFPQEGKNALAESLCSTIIENIFTESFVSSTIIRLEQNILNNPKNNINVNFSMSTLSSTLVSKFIDDYYDISLDMDNTRKLIRLFSEEIVNKLLEMPLKNFLIAE
ncbi:DUF445 family protein [Clostridium omnivorum]|uniref:Uncharacterized protein n=1 Tax=Clostridium omnivorum TaxID=1604902 RepID=A0ABQ5N0V6_9CLOT|nr:DUF445 family protein [Clostridium sp. E14]GLC28834.1 hypothetical protein bsdE14_02440 [Clostridium sp. E14]